MEMYRFNVSTDFGGVLKMHFGELKMRLLPTAPIHIVWHNETCLTVYKLVNVFFI
jgi:hypothetical protein